MKRVLLTLTLLLFVSLVVVFGDEIPLNIRNNRYYEECLRMNNLARLAYAEGDYDASIQYSEEAIYYAQLSDGYVRLRLKMWEADTAIAGAGRRLDHAFSINAAARFHGEYASAQAAYGEARAFRAAESWDEAIEAANRVLLLLAFMDGETEFTGQLPAQYVVRSWGTYKDCLWNIAGHSWAYNDPFKWKILYDANISKMPETGNPDLIEPGMILDIPSISGETRRGIFDPNIRY